jgi:hypothetical protein
MLKDEIEIQKSIKEKLKKWLELTQVDLLNPLPESRDRDNLIKSKSK